MNYWITKKQAFMKLVNNIKGFVRIISGIPPLTLPNCVDEESLIDYKIYGNSVQDGTPSLDNPIDILGVGEKTTKNMFDLNSLALGTHFKGVYGTTNRVKNGFQTTCTTSNANFRMAIILPTTLFENGKTYTISGNFENVRQMLIGHASDINDTATMKTLGTYTFSENGNNSATFTIKNVTKDYINFYIYGRNCKVGDKITVTNIQIEEGNTVTEYEPYGKYKIPIVAKGEAGQSVVNIIMDEPLKNIDGYPDCIDSSLKTLRVRTKSRVIDDTEACYKYAYDKQEGYSCFYFMVNGDSTSNVSYTVKSNYLPFVKHGYTLTNVGECISIQSNARNVMVIVRNEVASTVDEFKAWLKALSDSGKPFTIWYSLPAALQTSKEITVPDLPTHKGTTIYEVDTSVQPSKMEVTYYSTQKGE